MRTLLLVPLFLLAVIGCQTVTTETEPQPMASSQNMVIVEFIVDTEGRPREIQVVSEDDPALALAAVEAVRGWTFPPARVEGVPVNSRLRLPIVFPHDYDPGDIIPPPAGAEMSGPAGE